jgi:hypothetical protein
MFCFSAVRAQTAPSESPTEKEKARKEQETRLLEMLDQAVGEASVLKLPRNRAVVYAIAGDLFWKFDEKRARELFRLCESEIIAANEEAEKEKKENEDLFSGVFIEWNNIRSDILPMIARHDADLALQMLASTRPAKLAEAMAKAAQPNAKQDGGYMNFNPDQMRVQQEIALEQQFAIQAADQSPDKAIKLLKDSLSKGISWNVLVLLQKIHKKDEKKAASLADDVVRKIVDTDLTKKRDDLNAAVQFLQYATNPNQSKTAKEKTFQFNETQVRDIANKLAATFMLPIASLDMTMVMSRVMPTLEKIIPEKAPLLKQKQTESMKNMPPEIKQMQQRQKLWNQNSTPEEIIAELPKLNEFQRAPAYMSLQNKIAQIEDEARAKKLIEQIPDEKARTQANESYESAKISRAASEGKLDDAKKMIKNLSQKKTQVQKLVALAVQFHKKNTEKDLETAAGLMKDAKALTNEFPEDENELNDLMEIVRGYATIDPPEAFRLFEPIVDQLNDYVQASAILSKYNKRSQTFKKGELLLNIKGYSWDGQLLFRYIDQIKLLGKADLNKMNAFSDKFQRTDARTIVKLFIAQGFFREEKKDENSTDSGGMFSVID